jgi:aspartyl-tRNA(Asn)/glutamyl-tRNA(Gln) amidotransferase subunit A
LHFSSIKRAQQALANKEITLPELVHHYLDQIEQRNETINAVISLDKQAALQQAEAIQKRIERGEAGKLTGAVIGVKDLICEMGRLATCASEMLANFTSVYDATAVQNMKEEDALLLGRLNMDEFAMGSSSENSAFGVVQNPHDSEKVPGGSSGGSAAAVAADFCTAALGSDTGGSVRQPASYCGVVGLKPTYGRVSRHGLVAFASSFDCIGPLCRSVHDAAALLEVIAGEDPNDQTTSGRPVPSFQRALEKPDSNVRIGVPGEYFSEGLDEEIAQGIRDKLTALENDGAELVPINLPHTPYCIATYYVLATAEASSNLARYDGIRYGHRADLQQVIEDLAHEKAAYEEQMQRIPPEGETKILPSEKIEELDSSLVRLYKESRSQGFGEEVKRRIMLGTYVLSAGYYDAYYAKAQKVRRLIQQDFTEAFRKVDVIASPTTPTTAFDIGAKTDDPLQMYLNDVYTTSANLAGICAISVPAGIHSNGLPYGIQFMGKPFAEQDIFNSGRLIEQLEGD